MITNEEMSCNGTNGHFLACPSDYEPAPTIPTQPVSRREGSLDPYMLNLGWHDNDGIVYSLTIRGQERDQVMADAKFFKAVARAHMAKGKVAAAVANPDAPQGQTQPEHVVCKIHGVEMERRVSKRTQGHYHAHRLGPRDLCFGRIKT